MNHSKNAKSHPPKGCFFPVGGEIPNRRGLLKGAAMGAGWLAFRALAANANPRPEEPAAPRSPVRARRVIYLFQSGGPSQLDLFDHKPLLNELQGQQLPDSVRQGQRLTGMSGNQSSIPLVGSPYRFRRCGDSGLQLSELLPYHKQIADELCLVRSLHTEAINHGPGVTMMQTGSQFPGRPSMGAWLDYGLGSENEELPAFVVMVTKDKGGQPLVSRLWGNGFLPARHQGVRFRSGKDPVLYLENPQGIEANSRASALKALNGLHRAQHADAADALLENRILQYEMAFRMQRSVPEALTLSDEPEHILEMYGEDVRRPGSFAYNCLMARRLIERDVRFVQLYHPGWDQHGSLPQQLPVQCRETDQPSAALVADLKQRGLLDDTLVVWGGEFGRTNYCQGKLSAGNFGRDHHPRCFSMWMAGGGIKPGYVHGETDDYGYSILADGVHVHDLHATMLHLMGIDHKQLTFRYQGREFRLTDVHGKVVEQLLA